MTFLPDATPRRTLSDAYKWQPEAPGEPPAQCSVPKMTFPMPAADATAALQAQLDAASRAGAPYTFAAGGYRLASTGLGYSSNARIYVAGDLYNDHGPLVGTLYCLTNRTTGRLSNVTITGQGGAFTGAATALDGATRKGLGIVATDGFTVTGVKTAGPLNGFGMEVKNSTRGVLSNLSLLSGLNTPGADGLHFFGACAKVTGSNIVVSSGDDALSFTCENSESMNAALQSVTLTGLTLNSDAFSCIKFYTSTTTGVSSISNINLSNITGRITQGPTGCPLMMENTGVAQGCTISDITITNADLNFGAATEPGPTAYLTDVNNVTLTGITLRGRLNGQFLRAVRCNGLKVQGEVWETIPGSSLTDMVQLEECSNYSIDLVVRSAAGVRTGSISVSNTGWDTVIRYIGVTGS